MSGAIACSPTVDGLVSTSIHNSFVTSRKLDQIVPFFVLEVANKVPGLSGLFIAGIFSAALSSISSILNTKAGIIYEDFIRHRYPEASEKRASDVMKLLVVGLGFIMLSLVFVVEHLGSIFRLNYSINGLTVSQSLLPSECIPKNIFLTSI